MSGETSAPEAGARRLATRESLAVVLATSAYGASFGALSVSSGLSVWQTCALSLVMFTGASQFALIGVVASGGSPAAGALTALLLGSRNTLYGLRLGPLLPWRRWRRAAAAHLVIDESTAMAVTRTDRGLARHNFLVTGLGIFVGWNLTTLLGALAGNAIGDPRDYGLDAAAIGAFLALLWPRLTDAFHRLVAVAAAVVAVGLVPLTMSGVPVLAAGGVAVLAGVLTRSRGLSDEADL